MGLRFPEIAEAQVSGPTAYLREYGDEKAYQNVNLLPESEQDKMEKGADKRAHFPQTLENKIIARFGSAKFIRGLTEPLQLSLNAATRLYEMQFKLPELDGPPSAMYIVIADLIKEKPDNPHPIYPPIALQQRLSSSNPFAFLTAHTAHQYLPQQ